jgi:RNA polymerase sigma-70 factor (sigma-E family)
MARWEAPEAFAEFVRDRHSELLRFAYALAADRHLAEDLVQDALERTGLAWRRVRRQDDVEGYARRVITNQFLNRLRKLRRERLVDDLPDLAVAAHESADDSTWRALAQLPPAQRAAVVARYYLDLTEAQAADLLGCSVGTVKSNTFRALAKLRARLAPTPEGTR